MVPSFQGKFASLNLPFLDGFEEYVYFLYQSALSFRYRDFRSIISQFPRSILSSFCTKCI